VDDARTLLGKRTPFVGRERELAFSSVSTRSAPASQGRARCWSPAPAGSGKSRLAQELRVRLPRSAQVWRARGDPGGAGSPFGMLAPALRRTAGILDGEPLELRQMKLRARVARHLGGEAVTRVSEFIGELVGARFDNGQRIELQAARRDLVLMGDQMRRAFEDWVAAETAGAPLVLVLEDLQWGDLPTVKFVDAALRHAADRPLLVVALARPEVHQLFPALWAERGVQELRLGELTRRSSERLVRAALGDAADETVAELCDRAAGNPLYLEELIRAVSGGPLVAAADGAGHGGGAPGPARARGPPHPARGQRLRPALLARRGRGAARRAGGEPELPEWLDILVSREVLVRRAERRFPGEHDYAFRHALVRDAAYAMLTDADRTLGHGLAASWLRQAGEEDPVVLAEHLAAGPPEGRPRAAVQLARAAEQALEGNDLAAAVLRAEGGLALATDDATRGRLLLALADARSWLGEFADAEEAAAEALVRLPRASAAWLKAVAQLAVACVRRGNLGRVMPLVDELLAVGAPADPEALAALVESGARTANLLLLGGRRELGTALLAGIARIAADAPGPVGPAAAATLLAARATEALYAGMPDACHELSQAAAASYLEAGALRLACVYKSNAAFACIEGGALAEAEAVLRELLPLARRLGTPNILASAQHNLGHVLAQRGALDEAVAHEREAVAILCAQGDRRLEGSARLYLAYALERGGEAAAAEAEAERAVELLSVVPPLRAHALAALAGLRLLAGRALEARTLVEQALAILAELGSLEEGESRVRLVDVETLEALGRRDEARAALAVAAARVLARAEKIRGPWRRSFLALPDNARTLELARARGV
jgi:tetratricopeptide (TPR) repeat protein